MAEQADALRSKRSGRNLVRVRISPSLLLGKEYENNENGYDHR